MQRTSTPARAMTWMRPARQAVCGLLDAWLPQTCVGCAEWIACETGPLCASCAAAIEQARDTPFCPGCLRTVAPVAVRDGACGFCRRERHWTVAAATRVGPYGVDPLREALLAVKFGGSERAADLVGDLLARRMEQQPWLDDLDAFVPVPMHRLRRLQRPAAHAALLARALARALIRRGGRRIAVWEGAAARSRYAPSQMSLSVRGRRFENVRGCFRADVRRVRGRHVCVVDNLLVTGATVHELVKALRKAGARKIYLAVVARAAAPGEPLLHATPPG